MGIDYSGGMIVGAQGSDLSVPEDYDGELWEFAEENGLEYMSQYYDCEDDYRYYGFLVGDVQVSDIDKGWLSDVKEKAEKFRQLTGVSAALIGSQDIY